MSIGRNSFGVVPTASQIVGTSTNDSAPAGNIGEFVTSTKASGAAVALTNSTTANVVSVSLTAGDWDVSGAVNFALAGVTGTKICSGISLTSSTLPSQAGGSGLGTDALSVLPLITTLVTDTASLHIAPVRVSLASTATVYLVANQVLSVGTSGAYGTLRARRVR